MRCTGVILVVTALAGVAWADGPQTDEQKRADVLFAEGRKLIDAHDDAGACAKFTEAIKLDPSATGTMLNLGLCNQNLKRYATALKWFRKAQFKAHEAHLAEYEKAAGDRTTELVALVATVTISFSGDVPPDTKVRIDGENVPPDDLARAEVDTGHHALDAGAPGFKTVHQEFDVEGKGGQTLTVTLVKGDNSIIVDRGAGRRKAALITAIGGGALLIASGVVSFWAKHQYDKCIVAGKPENTTTMDGQPTAPCPSTEVSDPVAYVNRYHDMARYWATPLFGVGAAAVAIGAYLYFTAPQRERIDRTVFVPSVGPDQVGFSAVGHF